MADLFISYSRSDRAFVDRLGKALTAEGHRVWYDRGLQPGNRFAAVIESEINRADKVIVVWSDASAHSQWVPEEAQIGYDQHKLIPVALALKSIPVGFRGLHTIDLSDFSGAAAHAGFLELNKAMHASSKANGTQSGSAASDVSSLVQTGAVAAALSLLVAAIWAVPTLKQNAAVAPDDYIQVFMALFIVAAISVCISMTLAGMRMRRLGLRRPRALYKEFLTCCLYGLMPLLFLGPLYFFVAQNASVDADVARVLNISITAMMFLVPLVSATRLALTGSAAKLTAPK
jgi:TIR domain